MNSWGYAFVTKIENTTEQFSLYLGFVSFYSSYNSQLIKVGFIDKDTECTSLDLFYDQ